MESLNVCFLKLKKNHLLFIERVAHVQDFRMESSSGEKQRSSVASQFFTGTEDASIDMTTNEKVSLVCSRMGFDRAQIYVYSLKDIFTVKYINC